MSEDIARRNSEVMALSAIMRDELTRIMGAKPQFEIVARANGKILFFGNSTTPAEAVELYTIGTHYAMNPPEDRFGGTLPTTGKDAN